MRKADPEKRSDTELLAWAASILQRAQSDKTTGVVRISLQEGVIQRANVERIEVPSRTA